MPRYTSMPNDLRYAVYERDHYTCQDCGLEGKPGYAAKDLQANHIKPVKEGGKHELDNLITVCLICHKKRDKHLQVAGIREAIARRKRNRDENGRCHWPADEWLMSHAKQLSEEVLRVPIRENYKTNNAFRIALSIYTRSIERLTKIVQEAALYVRQNGPEAKRK